MPAKEGIREFVDTVGYTVTRDQIESVIRQSMGSELESIRSNQEIYSITSDTFVMAALSPHDDYVYAAPVYVHIIPYVKAQTVILFGVCHGASIYNLENKIVFDSFEKWECPYGPVPVSHLRDEIINDLDPGDYTVNDEIHAREHSVEAILPFLQYYNRNVEIIPVLIPAMRWDRLDELSRRFARSLSAISRKRKLHMGKDIAFILSLDCVHYGDQGWGNRPYNPFGCDIKGYDQAVRRDTSLINNYLAGVLNSQNLKTLYSELVDPENPASYRITWCGRFSVPFGLQCLLYMTENLTCPVPSGILLKYSTSVALGELEYNSIGLGVNAPSNLHHWVGYAAVGYV